MTPNIQTHCTINTTQNNIRGNTALHNFINRNPRATGIPASTITQWKTSGVNPNQLNDQGRSALSLAIISRNFPVFLAFLNDFNFTNSINQLDDQGLAPIHHATKIAMDMAVKIEQQNLADNSPEAKLYLNMFSIIDILALHGADINLWSAETDSDGQRFQYTAMDYLSKTKNEHSGASNNFLERINMIERSLISQGGQLSGNMFW